jgi:hypothetical protein
VHAWDGTWHARTGLHRAPLHLRRSRSPPATGPPVDVRDVHPPLTSQTNHHPSFTAGPAGHIPHAPTSLLLAACGCNAMHVVASIHHHSRACICMHASTWCLLPFVLACCRRPRDPCMACMHPSIELSSAQLSSRVNSGSIELRSSPGRQIAILCQAPIPHDLIDRSASSLAESSH